MKHLLIVSVSLVFLSFSAASSVKEGQDTTNRQFVQEAKTAMKHKGIILPPNSPARVLPQYELIFVEFYNPDFSQILARAYFNPQGHRYELIDSGKGIPKIVGSSDLSTFSTADSLWKHIKGLESKVPDSWPILFNATSEFLTRYPHDYRRWEAKMLWFEWPPFIDVAMLKRFLAEVVVADDAPESIKRYAREWSEKLARHNENKQAALARHLASAAPSAPKTHFYDDRLDGRSQVATAIQSAKAENKRVLIEIGGDACHWCVRLHAFFADNKAVAAKLKDNYIVVLLAVNERNVPLLNEFGNPHMKHGIPVIVILDSDGTQLTTQDTNQLEEGSTYNLEKVLKFLGQWKWR